MDVKRLCELPSPLLNEAIRALERVAPAPAVDIASLSDDKARLKLAHDAGRHSIVQDLKNAIHSQQQEQEAGNVLRQT